MRTHTGPWRWPPGSRRTPRRPRHRVVRRLQQKRRHRGEERDLAHAIGAVGAQITCTLAGPHRKAHQCGIAQVERRHERVQICGEGVIVIARPGLTRTAEASAVVRDDPVARVEQDRKLLLPGRPAQGPPVNQHDGATRAVVLVVEIDRSRVLLTDTDVWHERLRSIGAKPR